MKKDQVPQDDANLMEGRSRELCYAVDENGRYVPVLSAGWEPKNTTLLQAWEQIGEEAREAFDRVREGRVSPLAFYMAKGMFDVPLLSAYTGIPKRKIKSHLKPETFRSLDRDTLAVYADIFEISLDELAQGPETPRVFPGEK